MNSALEEALFALAVRKPVAERSAFLERECGGDSALKHRIEQLLPAHESPDSFLEPPVSPLAEATVVVPAEEGPGTVIGHYKILEKVGEGGFGVVYVAEQREPVKRRVALKIIKLGMDTRQVVARFEAERQALALMDHPNIAKVLDGGATETGRPYFVMELVHGVPITQYCDQNNLSTEKRLKLFIQVCQAIQHAHQKGIIHRDIKPSNILVTLQDPHRSPVPKVIDFGIAKATQQPLTDKTVYTQLEQFIGTPAYMSPEQAEMSGLDIDTRSDIYSLGVLLYQLLVGRTPFDAAELLKSGLEAMRRTIREKEPVRPSIRLGSLPEEERTTTARRRAAEAGKLIGLLRGDLDWIVMKCLEKDRTLRYDTANGLAMDVERFQKNEPVAARPHSAADKVRKFVRRNRVMVTAGATVGAVLVLGISVSIWQAVRATRAEREQTRLRASAEANAYAGDMNLAQRALQEDDLGKARSLLDRYRPGLGLERLRGFEWRYLAAQAVSDYALSDTSSPQSVFSLALSPDGQVLAVGRQRSVELWDPASLKRIAILETNVFSASGSLAVAFSPTGRLLAASAPRGGIGLWQLEPWRIVGELVHTNGPTSLSFSPDGKHLASMALVDWSAPVGLRLWDLENRRTVSPDRHFPPSGEYSRVCFSPDGRHLAVGGGSGRITILDCAADRVLVEIQAHTQAITSLAYSPDGKLLASGSGFSADDIRLWNPATGEPAGSLAGGHHGWIPVLQFSADGQRLFSGSADQTIGIWDVPTRRLTQKLRGHLDEIYSLVFDARQNNLITGCKDGTLARWDIHQVRQHLLRLDLPGNNRSPVFAGSGSSVAMLDGQGAVALWHTNDPQRLSVIAALGTQNTALATALGRRLLACANPAGSIRIWSLQSSSLVTNLVGHGGRVDGLWFSRGEDFLLAWSSSWISSGHLASIWDANTWSRRFSITETNGPGAGCAALSPDGHLLVRGLEDGQVEWWDAVRDHRLEPIPCHRQGVRGLDFSPDGSTLASASQDGTVALWDVRTRRCTAHWKAGLLGLVGVAFSPDGARLATALGAVNPARLWDLKTRRELLTVEGPGGWFSVAKFSPDGGALLCAGDGHCFLLPVPSFAELDAAR